MSERILDRIRKLLRLAGNAGSENEAALAAARAQELMAEHEIHEAQVSLDDPAVPRTPEPIEPCYDVTHTKRRVAWHFRITDAVAESYGAEAYWHGHSVAVFGRLSAVQATGYTAQYLMREVERIVDIEAPSPTHTRRYRNAFRLGCAARVAKRLREHTAVTRKAQGFTDYDRSALPDYDPDAEVEADDKTPEVQAEPTPASAGVIARVASDRAEVKAGYEAYSKGWGSAVRVGQVSSGSGYRHGKSAGDRIKLGGGGRGGLPSGQGSLP